MTRRNRKKRGSGRFTQFLRNKFGYEPLGSSTSALAREINSMLDTHGIKANRLADFDDLMSVHKNVNRKNLFRDLNKLGISHYQYVAIVDALHLNETMQLPLEVVLTIIKSMLDDKGIKRDELDNFNHFMITHQINIKKLMPELIYELNNDQIAHILFRLNDLYGDPFK